MTYEDWLLDQTPQHRMVMLGEIFTATALNLTPRVWADIEGYSAADQVALIVANTRDESADPLWEHYCQEHPEPDPSETDAERNGTMQSFGR